MQGKKVIAPIRSLLNIHQALLLSMVGPIGMGFLPLNRIDYTEGSTNFKLVQYIAVGSFLIGNLVSSKLFRQQLRRIYSTYTLPEKLPIYSQASIVKFAFLFIVQLLCALGFLLTNHWSLFALFIVQFIIFFSQRPHPILASGHLGVEKERLYE